jgi:hypothetical protein
MIEQSLGLVIEMRDSEPQEVSASLRPQRTRMSGSAIA